MSEHAPFAPSAAHRWMHCAGSHAACLGKPDNDSEYSREGTFAHTLAAKCLTEDADAASTIGETDGEFTCDAGMAAHIQVYLDAVRACMLVTEGTLFIEQRVYITGQLYGTADAIVVGRDGVLYMFDLKFGAGVIVSVVGNEQLRIYAYGALMLSKITAEQRDTLHTVRMTIVQPRAGGDPCRSEDIAVDALCDWIEAEVHPAIERALAPNAPLTAGDHCRFCPAHETCPALQAAALEVARDVFPVAAEPSRIVAPPSPDSLSNAQIAAILKGAAVFSQWVSSVTGAALARARAGQVIPGFKLVEALGHRRWIDEAHAAQTLQAVGCADPFERTLMSPAAIEKKNKTLKAVVAKLVTRPSNGVKLVADTADGKALPNPFSSLD